MAAYEDLRRIGTDEKFLKLIVIILKKDASHANLPAAGATKRDNALRDSGEDQGCCASTPPQTLRELGAASPDSEPVDLCAVGCYGAVRVDKFAILPTVTASPFPIKVLQK